MQASDILVGAFFGATVSLVALLSPPVANAGATVAFRPPGWVFAVAWPILYAVVGYAWALGRASSPHPAAVDRQFVALTAATAAWIPVYAKAPAWAAALLGCTAVYAWWMEAGLGGPWLLPLAAWLTFATSINVAEAW